MKLFKFNITVKFAWYNLWLGIYFDRQDKALYVFPVPMLGFLIERDSASGASRRRVAPRCVPSTTGSASAAVELSAASEKLRGTIERMLHLLKAEDEAGVDNSVVQLPVSGSAATWQEAVASMAKCSKAEVAWAKFCVNRGDEPLVVLKRFDEWLDKVIISCQPPTPPSGAGASGGS